MKRYIKYSLIAVIAVGAFIACKRDYPVHSPYMGVEGSAYLKIVHASPNFAKIFQYPDAVNVFIGNDKINGTALKYNTAFPGLTNGVSNYATVKAGAQTIRVSIAGSVNPDSFTVAKLDRTLEAGSFYTLIITDSIASASRDSARVWIRDAFPKPAAGPGYVYLRFAHVVFSDKTDTVAIYSPRRNQTLFQKVKMDSITPFIAFPTLTMLDTLLVMKTDSTHKVMAKLLPTLIMGDQQYYTTYYIGDSVVATAKPRSLVYFQNR
jgi:hypothetical protein